jgi:hypothetical protein
MRALIFTLLCVWVAGCSTRLTDSEIDSFFDRQIGRVLPEAEAKGCEAVPVRDGVVEYIPRVAAKAGWSVVWQVDTTRAAALSASSSTKITGVIVAWRIIGDRAKVRVPVSYSAG